MTRHPLHPLAALAAAMLALALLAGCGSSADDSATTAATGAASSEATAGTTATSGGPATSAGGSSSGATTAATDDASATVIEAAVAGGKVTVSDDRFEVAKGTEVVIRVTDDVEEPIHLHGYDIEADTAPGKPAEIRFTADIPGVFEVELEDSGTLLFELEVK